MYAICEVRIERAGDAHSLETETVCSCGGQDEAWAKLCELTRATPQYQYEARWKPPELREEFLQYFLTNPAYLGKRRYFVGAPPAGVLEAAVADWKQRRHMQR
jgi:hypothetical protein